MLKEHRLHSDLLINNKYLKEMRCINVKKKYAITMSTVTYSKDIALLKVVHVLFIMIYLNHTVYDYLLEFVHVIIRGPNSCLTCKGNCSSWYTSI